MRSQEKSEKRFYPTILIGYSAWNKNTCAFAEPQFWNDLIYILDYKKMKKKMGLK